MQVLCPILKSANLPLCILFCILVCELIHQADGCFAYGGGYCGGCSPWLMSGSGCYYGGMPYSYYPHSNCYSGGASGCGGGYGGYSSSGGCGGSYGYRMGLRRRRAHLPAYEKNIDKNAARKRATTPDQLFSDCCARWDLSDGCRRKCSYRNYTVEALTSMFWRQSILASGVAEDEDCPLAAATIIHYCATGNRDHRTCCRSKLAFRRGVDDKCLIFCDRMPKQPVQLNFSYLPCLERFPTMVACFRDAAHHEVQDQHIRLA